MGNDESDSKRLKTAYELALERMESDGIKAPRAEVFDAETLAAIAEIRSQSKAKLAELEILHDKRIATVFDPAKREQEERGYQAERRRLEERQDFKIAEIREQSG